MNSGGEYSGQTALDIVDQMRRADFDPPTTVREYIAIAVYRASHYFGVTLRVDAINEAQEAVLAEKFLAEAIAKGFAEEVTTS